MLAALKPAMCGQVGMRDLRLNLDPKPLAVAESRRRMDRLADRWKRKLEAEAIIAQHAGLRAEPNESNTFESSRTRVAIEDTENLNSDVLSETVLSLGL